MIGLDTGFFFLLHQPAGEAARLLEQITREDEAAAVSTITLYELLRHGMRGAIPQAVVDLIVDNTAHAFYVAGVDAIDVLRRAAAIRHGMGLHMADALIAASLEHVGCTDIYTTNRADFERYTGPMRVTILS